MKWLILFVALFAILVMTSESEAGRRRLNRRSSVSSSYSSTVENGTRHRSRSRAFSRGCPPGGCVR